MWTASNWQVSIYLVNIIYNCLFYLYCHSQTVHLTRGPSENLQVSGSITMSAQIFS